MRLLMTSIVVTCALLLTAHGGDEQKAWHDLGHAFFNLKEFLYLR